MSSPAVWTDASTRAGNAAAALGLSVAWPNEAFDPPNPPAPFLAIEISGDVLEAMELGGSGWEETGTLHLHVMVPTGTGIDAGLGLRKSLANAFRGLAAAPVTWRDAILDPGGPADEDGVWYRLTLRLAYSYQDFATPA